jgi:hypothetical protein
MDDVADETGVNIIFANNAWKLTHQQCMNKHIPVITVGRCLFGDRFEQVAIGWDGFNGAADFCLDETMPPERWEMNGWELTTDILHQVNGDRDGYVLVCGEYRPTAPWISQLKTELKGQDVRFRSHPFKNDTVPGWANAPAVGQDNIAQLFPQTKVVVTFDSISGCDAVLAGIPAICYGENAMARPASYKDWASFQLNGGKLHMGVQDWANRLAYCQWTHAEIAAGDWWTHLEAGLEARINKARNHTHLSQTTRMRNHHRLLKWRI